MVQVGPAVLVHDGSVNFAECDPLVVADRIPGQSWRYGVAEHQLPAVEHDGQADEAHARKLPLQALV